MRNRGKLFFGGLLGLMIVFLFFGVMVPAYSDTADTPSGTVITADADECTLNYKDSGGISKPTVNPASDIETTVAAIYGLSGPGTPADQSSSGYADPKYYTYTLTNEGNASDNYNLTVESVSYGNGASGWTVRIWDIGREMMINQLTVAEDSTAQFVVQVIPASAAEENQYADVTIKAYTSETPVGEYTGSNGLTYGGSAEVSDIARTTISGAPTLTLTRTATVDAPADFSGDAHAHVPGAVITYTYTYSNTGGGSAESNVIVDKIPTNTQAVQVNATEVSNVSITASQSSATGWTVFTSEASSPGIGFRDYGATEDWTIIGTISAGSDYATNSSGAGNFVKGIGTNTTYIKFEKSSIDPSEDSKTLMWGVTIK